MRLGRVAYFLKLHTNIHTIQCFSHGAQNPHFAIQLKRETSSSNRHLTNTNNQLQVSNTTGCLRYIYIYIVWWCGSQTAAFHMQFIWPPDGNLYIKTYDRFGFGVASTNFDKLLISKPPHSHNDASSFMCICCVAYLHSLYLFPTPEEPTRCHSEWSEWRCWCALLADPRSSDSITQ